MHYYQFNIADYRKDTAHLIPIEHYIYRSLIDWYYLDEKPIPLETQVVIRRLCLGSDMVTQLTNVLNDFFKKTEKGYIHKRIDIEIAQYHEMAEKNRVNGKLGGTPRKTQSVILANPNETQINPNQELITNNHKPENKEKPIRATRFPKEKELSQEWVDSALKIKPYLLPENISIIFDTFKDYWIAKTGKDATKEDWLATWRNWVRRDSTNFNVVTTIQKKSKMDITGIDYSVGVTADGRF